MKPLRWVAGGLVGLIAGLLATVGCLLSVTIILLPLGIPILMLARRLFSLSARLVLPRAVVHPVREMRKTARGKGIETVDRARKALPQRRSVNRFKRRKRRRKRMRGVRKRLRLT